MGKLTHKEYDHSLKIEELYKQELQSLHEKISKQAAQSLLKKLQPNNKITVEQLFLDLKQHKAMWEEISGMGALDFLCKLMGDRKIHVSDEKINGQRTRLTNKQIESLHVKILQILNEHRDGLNRKQISSYFSVQEIKNLQIDPRELFDKLRIPLFELIKQGSIHSTGNKRLLKYFPVDGNKGFDGSGTASGSYYGETPSIRGLNHLNDHINSGKASGWMYNISDTYKYYKEDFGEGYLLVTNVFGFGSACQPLHLLPPFPNPFISARNGYGKASGFRYLIEDINSQYGGGNGYARGNQMMDRRGREL